MLLSPEIALENGSSVKIGIGDRRGGRRGLLSSIEVVKWLCLYPVKARSCSFFLIEKNSTNTLFGLKIAFLKK